MRMASAAVQMSPFPSTGVPSGASASLRRAIASQSAVPAYIWAAVRPCRATHATPSSAAARPASR